MRKIIGICIILFLTGCGVDVKLGSNPQPNSWTKDKPSEFFVRDIPTSNSDDDRGNVEEVIGHNKKCYVYLPGNLASGTTLWCEDVKP